MLCMLSTGVKSSETFNNRREGYVPQGENKYGLVRSPLPASAILVAPPLEKVTSIWNQMTKQAVSLVCSVQPCGGCAPYTVVTHSVGPCLVIPNLHDNGRRSSTALPCFQTPYTISWYLVLNNEEKQTALAFHVLSSSVLSYP